MKIAFLVDSFPTISETFILNQITGLIDAGHEVVIISGARPDERDFHSDIRKYDLLKKTYYHNDRPRNKFLRIFWALALFMVYAARNFKAVTNSLNVIKYGKEAASLTYYYKVMLFLGIGHIDIFYCQYGPNGNFAVLLKELGIKARIIVMFHGYDIRRGIEQGGKIYEKVFKSADYLLSISDYNYRYLVEFGAPVEKIKVHPVGIDLKRYQYIDRPEAPQDLIKIISVGRLVKEKGMAAGIRAVHCLSREHPQLRFEYVIIGSGPLRDDLEALVKGLGMTDKVRFFGACLQESVIESLNKAHIFLLPSVAEALPVVLMEAMAVGLPVVATNVGSVKQLVINGKSGYLVEAEDISAMSERLNYIISNPRHGKELGKEGRSHIVNHYDVEKLNQKLVELFREVVSS